MIHLAADNGYIGITYKNVVVVDIGRSYEKIAGSRQDCVFNNIKTIPQKYDTNKISIYELEELKAKRTERPEHIYKTLLKHLKEQCSKDTLLIIDEVWDMHEDIVYWALAEFEGETLISAQGTCINEMGAEHLFSSGVSMLTSTSHHM